MSIVLVKHHLQEKRREEARAPSSPSQRKRRRWTARRLLLVVVRVADPLVPSCPPFPLLISLRIRIHPSLSSREKEEARAPPSPSPRKLGSPYYKGIPLPRISSVRKLVMRSRIAQRSEHASVWPRGTYSHAGQSTTEPRRQYSRSVGTAQYAFMIWIPRSWAVLDPARRTDGISRQSTCGESH